MKLNDALIVACGFFSALLPFHIISFSSAELKSLVQLINKSGTFDVFLRAESAKRRREKIKRVLLDIVSLPPFFSHIPHPPSILSSALVLETSRKQYKVFFLFCFVFYFFFWSLLRCIHMFFNCNQFLSGVMAFVQLVFKSLICSLNRDCPATRQAFMSGSKSAL